MKPPKFWGHLLLQHNLTYSWDCVWRLQIFSEWPFAMIILVHARKKNAAVLSGKWSTAFYKVRRLLNVADKTYMKTTTILAKPNTFIFQNAPPQTISFDDHMISFILALDTCTILRKRPPMLFYLAYLFNKYLLSTHSASGTFMSDISGNEGGKNSCWPRVYILGRHRQ